MTIDDIAKQFGVDKPMAYGLIRFLESRQLAQSVGVRKEPGARGKGAKLYAFKPDAIDQLRSLFSALPTL